MRCLCRCGFMPGRALCRGRRTSARWRSVVLMLGLMVWYGGCGGDIFSKLSFNNPAALGCDSTSAAASSNLSPNQDNSTAVNYYANLISSNSAFLQGTWDDSPNITPIETQSSPIIQPIGSVRPNNKRSANYKECEDNLLVSSWLNTSLDAAIGNEQSNSSYWARIYQFYHANKTFESDRNQSSLSNRFATIQKEVQKFSGWYDQIQNRRQSGMTESDKIIQACSSYQGVEKENKSFVLLHCWRELRNHPKWLALLSSHSSSSQKKQKKNSNANPGTSTPVTVSSQCDEHIVIDDTIDGDKHLKRPEGKKKAKELLKQGKCSGTSKDNSVILALNDLLTSKEERFAKKEAKKEERYARSLAQEDERIRLDKIKIELKQRDSDERIMLINLDGMDASLQQYYMGLKNDIIARRGGNLG